MTKRSKASSVRKATWYVSIRDLQDMSGISRTTIIRNARQRGILSNVEGAKNLYVNISHAPGLIGLSTEEFTLLNELFQKRKAEKKSLTVEDLIKIQSLIKNKKEA
jgi:hypothetical protein